jgi:alpha-galactosidase
MVSSGLAAHGFQYISIDDTWEGKRNAQGEIQPNEKFPDMKALTEYLHGKGLKAGIYSGPGPTTCEGFPGSYRYEAQDAASYARWGFDLLKYDWCSYSSIAKDESLPELQKPYQLMSNLLRSQPRDIVFSLCQYGMGTVWEWGESAGGQMWRTSGDLVDVWSNMASVGFRQAGREKYSGPGHWTDPDMLVVGKVAIGGGTPHDSRLTPNEQVTHISLWSLQAAPLLIGCDLAHMDQFTKDLLTNDEVLDIDQDPLGRAAARVSRNERLEVWARPLADGTKAVGLFNRGLTSASITASWEDLGLTGSQPVRDVWLHKDLAPANGAFTATVPSHGTVLVRIGRPR